MKNVFRRACVYGLCPLALVVGAMAAENTPTRTAESEVIAVMQTIRAAYAAGDVKEWERLVAPTCEFVEPSGRFSTRRWHKPNPRPGSDPLPSKSKITEIKVVADGDAAVLSYREDTGTVLGDQKISSAVRFTEVYHRKAAQWQLIFSAETPIVEKKAVRVDPKIYDEYVGEYQIAPGLVGTVYRDADRLLLIGTGWKQPYELLPLGRDTFFVKEMPDNDISFVRDSEGKVIAQVGGSRGQEITGKKIK